MYRLSSSDIIALEVQLATSIVNISRFEAMVGVTVVETLVIRTVMTSRADEAWRLSNQYQ